VAALTSGRGAAQVDILRNAAAVSAPSSPSAGAKDGSDDEAAGSTVAASALPDVPAVIDLTPANLEVVFEQFPPTVIQAVLSEFDDDAIMAAKRLASMLESSGQQGQGAAVAALQRLGLGMIVDAQRAAALVEEEQDIEEYLQECYEEVSQNANAADFKMSLPEECPAAPPGLVGTRPTAAQSVLQQHRTSSTSEGQAQSSEALRSAAYLGALCCLAGGNARESFSAIPPELTASDCSLLREALLMAVPPPSPDSWLAPRRPSQRVLLVGRRGSGGGTDALGLSARRNSGGGSAALGLSPGGSQPPPLASPRTMARDSDKATLALHKRSLATAFQMRARLGEELERQMYTLPPNHSAPHFLEWTKSPSDHFTDWRM
jgi:hypothetical protein